VENKKLEGKDGTIIEYNDSRVIIQLYKEGTKWIFTRDNFSEFLTFLLYANAIMGKDKLVSNNTKGD